MTITPTPDIESPIRDVATTASPSIAAAEAEPALVLPDDLVPPALHVASRWRLGAAALGWGAAGLVLFGLFWQVAHLRTDALPGPLTALDTLRELLGDAFAPDGPAGQGIGLQLLASLEKVLKGFALAAVVGVPFGFLVGCSKRAYQIANPVIQVLRPVSPLAWFPIWLTIMVTSEPASIGVIFITAVWPVIINTAAGASSVPSYQHNVARVFRFSRWTELREIVVPHALPQVVTGLRLSLGIAWMVIVAAEMLSAASGIGFYVWQSYNGQGLPYVMAAIILIGVTGLAMDLCFQWLGRRVAHEEVAP
jgi:nitrate/nitrite transport system permease protein